MRHGFLLIDKPIGPTSHDVVGQMRRALHERDIGHLGTLDPLASGLMVLAVGAKALKVVELFNGLPKEYEAAVTFGATSTTYDADGTITPYDIRTGWEPPEQATIQRTVSDRFMGKIDQTPPIFSAVHVGGERAYRKARQGKNVAMPSRVVEVTACEVLDYRYPELRMRVACSAGTYIRSLANDLGEVLRCGAYLSGLRRTKVGEWHVADAKPTTAANWADVLPLKDVLVSLPKTDITPEQYQELRFGRDLPLQVQDNAIAWCEGLPVAILMPLRDGSGLAHPRKVF